MYSKEHVIQILEVVDLTKSYRAAAVLGGVGHHTVAAKVATRTAGLAPGVETTVGPHRERSRAPAPNMLVLSFDRICDAQPMGCRLSVAPPTPRVCFPCHHQLGARSQHGPPRWCRFARRTRRAPRLHRWVPGVGGVRCDGHRRHRAPRPGHQHVPQRRSPGEGSRRSLFQSVNSSVSIVCWAAGE